MTDKSKAAGFTPTDEPIQSCISQLRKLIKLDSMTRNYPDNYVQPTSQFASDNASEMSSALHSPEGAYLGSLCTERIKTLLQAYWNATNPH